MTADQAALIRKAIDSIRAARLLVTEELHEFAVSRAYYAMFYVVEAMLLGEGLAFSKHSAVIAAFGQRFVKTGRVQQEYHRYLIEGEDSRNVGDYDVKSRLSPADATTQIERAEQFVKLAESMLGPVPHESVE